MDRISALRNVEEVLRDLEAGEVDLETAERRAQTILRTFVTDFDTDGDSDGESLAAYRAHGDDAVTGLVVLAPSAAEARDRVRTLVDGADQVDVERL